MLRYQTSIHSNHHVDSRDSESFHSYSQPSTIASSNGPKAQQSRLIKRQSTTAYKSVPTCRLAPRRRYFVMDNHKSSMSGGGQSISFPGPDYLKRMKENYESGKIIYIRRPTGVNNSSIPSKMTSVINNSIRSTTYHTTTTSSNGKLTMETNGNVPKYVFRLPKNEFTKFDENRPQSNMYVPAYEPLKVQYTTVPACMSMGGEYVYEEEIEETELENDLKSEDLMPASPPSSGLITPKCESLEESSLSVNSLSLTSGNYSNNQSFKVLPMKNRLQPTKFTCPQPDCFWRGPTDLSLRKHIQVHGLKQPVIYNGNKTNLANNGDPMKVQLVQPKPKGVKCSECDTFAYSRPLLLRHMHDAHGIEAPLIRRTFANREMLQTWLDSLRETHAVEFVVSSGSKKWGRGLQVHYLTCSRSGDQKERPNKKYVRPPRPSIKCGRNCMAYLKIKQNPTVSELQIEGCLHHSGHEIDHSRMMLEPNELASIGEIVEIVNEGMDIMNNADALRGYLGNSGRFRLVSDRGIIEQMPVWFEQYNRAMSEYMNDGNQGPGNMYRGSGALSLSSVMPNSYCSSGPLVPITPATAAGPRKLSLGKTVVKRETDFSMPIRFGNPGMQNKQINKTGISMLERNDHQVNFNKMHIFDETKVKVEIDEDTLAAANLLKDDYGEFKTENIFDSPMIGGENSLVDENRVLVNSSRDMAASSGLNEMLSASSSDLFSNDFSSVDDINTDFNCAMDDAEFNQLLGFSDFNDRSINCS